MNRTMTVGSAGCLRSVSAVICHSVIKEAESNPAATLRGRLERAKLAMKRQDIGLVKTLLAEAHVVSVNFKLPFSVPDEFKELFQ